MQYRHGDLMVEEISALPADIGAQLPTSVLAHGELTGHSHRIQEADQVSLFQRPLDLILEVKGEKVSLVHDEHATIILQKGFYRVWRQREYSPEEIRTIRD